MNRNDLAAFKHVVRGLGWVIRANLGWLLAAASFVLLFPVQIVSWLLGPRTFLQTEPYRGLGRLAERGMSFEPAKIDMVLLVLLVVFLVCVLFRSF
jgi:hypothetical protein